MKPILKKRNGRPVLASGQVIKISSTGQQFFAKEKFKENTRQTAEVKISFIGHNFARFFLKGEGKIENPIRSCSMQSHKLNQDSKSAKIVNFLGGRKKSIIGLAELFELLKRGAVKTHSTMFYIRDIEGIVRVVTVYWDAKGYDIDARAEDETYTWHHGLRIFIRKSAAARQAA